MRSIAITLAATAIALLPILSTAQSATKERIQTLEVQAAHLLSRAQAYQATVSQATANLPRAKDGSIDSLQWLDSRDLNRKAASEIYADADNLRREAALALAEGRSSLGFFSVQQGETIALGSRIFAAVQVVDCVEFTTRVIAQNQSLPEALAFAKTVTDGCKKLVATLRGESPTSKK